MKINIKNILIYLGGIIVTALGVTIMKRTELGMGAWDAVIANVHTLLKIKLGTSSLIINIVLLIFVIAYRKSFKHLLVLIPILLNTLVLNFLDSYLLADVVFNNVIINIVMFVLSIIMLPLGLSLIIVSTLPKMIYDEITFILMEIIKTKNFGLTRFSFEIGTMMLAMLLGFIGGDIFMQIGIGTVIVTITLGYMIDFFLKRFKKIGIYKEIEV